jgi:hypothetical protein
VVRHSLHRIRQYSLFRLVVRHSYRRPKVPFDTLASLSCSGQALLHPLRDTATPP